MERLRARVNELKEEIARSKARDAKGADQEGRSYQGGHQGKVMTQRQHQAPYMSQA